MDLHNHIEALAEELKVSQEKIRAMQHVLDSVYRWIDHDENCGSLSYEDAMVRRAEIGTVYINQEVLKKTIRNTITRTDYGDSLVVFQLGKDVVYARKTESGAWYAYQANSENSRAIFNYAPFNSVESIQDRVYNYLVERDIQRQKRENLTTK